MFKLQVIDSFCPLDISWKFQSEYLKHDQFWWCSAGGLGEKNQKSQVNCPVFIASVGKLAKNTTNCAKQLLLSKHLVFLGEGWTPQKLKNVLKWGSAVVLCTLLTRLFFPFEKQTLTWTMPGFILIEATNWQPSFKILAGNEDLTSKLWSL